MRNHHMARFVEPQQRLAARSISTYKRTYKRRAGLLGAAILLVSSCLSVTTAQAAPSTKTAHVRVRESKLRAQPKFWAASVSELRYGDPLTLVGQESGWLKARTSRGKQGYVHPSVVTEKRIALSSDAAVDKRADTSDVVLAGKGFSKEVEREYAQSNPTLNFKAVNSMEQLKISDQELLSFMREGKLGMGAQ